MAREVMKQQNKLQVGNPHCSFIVGKASRPHTSGVMKGRGNRGVKNSLLHLTLLLLGLPLGVCQILVVPLHLQHPTNDAIS